MFSSPSHTPRLLSSDDFNNLFESFSYSAFRLETLPRYQVSGESEELAAYLEGAFLPPESPGDSNWCRRIAASTKKGLSWSRVHVMPDQLTPYLRYEIEWGYLFNAQAGEDIRLLFPNQAPPIPENLPFHDFWLFDDTKLVLMHYGENGKYLGAELIENESELPSYQQAKEFTLRYSTTLKNYLKELRNSTGKFQY